MSAPTKRNNHMNRKFYRIALSASMLAGLVTAVAGALSAWGLFGVAVGAGIIALAMLGHAQLRMTLAANRNAASVPAPSKGDDKRIAEILKLAKQLNSDKDLASRNANEIRRESRALRAMLALNARESGSVEK